MTCEMGLNGTGPWVAPGPDWEAAVEGGTMALVCVLAAAGNFLVPFALFKRDQLNAPSNRLVFSLTASNLMLVVMVLPLAIISAVQRDWPLGHTWCHLSAFLGLLMPLSSILTLALIAIDRYFAIVRPMVYARVITQARCSFMLAAIWVYAMACALPPFWGWSRYEFRPSQSSCMVAWYSSMSYSIFLLVSCFVVPCIVMATCYYSILQVARKKCRKIHVGTVSELVTDEGGHSELTVPKERLRDRKERSSETRKSLRLSFNEQDRVRLSKEKSSLPNLPITVFKTSPFSSTSALGLKLSSLHHKVSFSMRRPQWLPFHTSLAKGMRTVCLVLGAVVVTWFPYVGLILGEMFHGPNGLPPWYSRLATWLFYSAAISYPVIYGLYNRSIRKELKACICPSGGKATRGLPRRNSRKSSISGNSGSFLDHVPQRLRMKESAVKHPSRSSTTSSVKKSAMLGATHLLADMEYGGRKPSQDSGAVMSASDSDSDCEAQTSHPHRFREYYMARRVSAPSVLYFFRENEATGGQECVGGDTVDVCIRNKCDGHQQTKGRRRSFVPFMRLSSLCTRNFIPQNVPSLSLPRKSTFPKFHTHTFPRLTKDWSFPIPTHHKCGRKSGRNYSSVVKKAEAPSENSQFTITVQVHELPENDEGIAMDSLSKAKLKSSLDQSA